GPGGGPPTSMAPKPRVVTERPVRPRGRRSRAFTSGSTQKTEAYPISLYAPAAAQTLPNNVRGLSARALHGQREPALHCFGCLGARLMRRGARLAGRLIRGPL